MPGVGVPLAGDSRRGKPSGAHRLDILWSQKYLDSIDFMQISLSCQQAAATAQNLPFSFIILVEAENRRF